MKFDIKFDGLDELTKKLEKMEQAANELDGENNVPFSELFTPEFLKKHTQFTSLDDMFDKSPFTVETDEDFAAIPDDEWDQYISTHSEFSNWEEMMSTAVEEYTIRYLGF